MRKGSKPKDLKNLEDLSKFPFTVKTDLRDNYPFGLCAVPLAEVVRIHASSGTTGKPITGPYTQTDLEQWTECMARSLFAHGVRSNDICQNSYGMGLFTGGLGFHQGATRIGAAVIPISSGQTERQIVIMKDFGIDRPLQHPHLCLDHCREGGRDGRQDQETCRFGSAASAPSRGRSR